MAREDILVLGANGQVGHELRRALAGHGNITSLDLPEIDFADPEALRKLVRSRRPAVIINAAAYTAVDKAESDAGVAFTVNAAAPAILAEEAEALNACLVHYSTDYVFDGQKTAPYTEDDAPNPLSVYGRSKLDGERGAAHCSRRLIFRTSWVVSVHGHNFVKTILRLARERDTLKVVADQHGAPTSAALLADATATILEQMRDRPADDRRWGLYHLVAGGETSWHGLARHVVARAATLGWPLKARAENVAPITTADYPTPARRPANSRLDTARLRAAFGIAPPDWRQGVDRIVESLAAEVRA